MSSPLLYQTTEQIESTRLQYLFQKWHIEEGKLNGVPVAVLQYSVQDRQVVHFLCVGNCCDLAVDGLKLPGNRFPDRYRSIIGFIISWVMSDQIIYGKYIDFTK